MRADNHKALVSLLRENRNQASGLRGNIGIPMGIALIFTPGLVLGAFLSRNAALQTALTLVLIFAVLFYLENFLEKKDNKRFVRDAVDSGISKTEAEVFLKNVNWSEVFPEYEEDF